MSVEFRVEGPLEIVATTLQSWLAKTSIALVETPLFDSQNFTGLLLAEGSIRGLAVNVEPSGCDLRLSALASRTDWSMASEILGSFPAGVTLTREGESFSVEEWQGSGLEEAWRHDFEFSVQALQKSELHEVMLPLLGPFVLKLPDSMTSEIAEGRAGDADVLESRLIGELEELLVAYWANTMVINGEIPLSTWAGIPTVVYNARVIAPSFVMETGSPKVVPIESLTKILGDRAKSVGEDCWLLPELGDEPELKQQIIAASLDVEEFTKQVQANKPEKVFDPAVVPEAMGEFTLAIHQGIPFEGASAFISDKFLIPDGHMQVLAVICGQAYEASQSGFPDVEAGLEEVRQRVKDMPLPANLIELLVRKVYATVAEVTDSEAD